MNCSWLLYVFCMPVYGIRHWTHSFWLLEIFHKRCFVSNIVGKDLWKDLQKDVLTVGIFHKTTNIKDYTTCYCFFWPSFYKNDHSHCNRWYDMCNFLHEQRLEILQNWMICKAIVYPAMNQLQECLDCILPSAFVPLNGWNRPANPVQKDDIQSYGWTWSNHWSQKNKDRKSVV